MADKDKTEKKLEDYNDVFADILNVLLFKENLIKQENLKNGPTESVYKAAGGGLRGQFRDTSKYYQDAGIIISSFGMENQSEIDNDMPIRVMGYDYSSYRNQVDTGSGRYPVITIVLNFSDKRWDKPLSLKDMLKIPKGMENFVKNYQITVFDIAFLPDGTINQFKSTFKHVAHFFKNKRKPENYQPLNEEIEHLEAFLDLLKAFTGDEKYISIKDELLKTQKEGKVVTMCSIVEKFTNEGIKQGIERGIKQGIERGIEQGIEQKEKQIILNMHKKGCDATTIADLSGIDINTVNTVLNNFCKSSGYSQSASLLAHNLIAALRQPGRSLNPCQTK
ncbi:MAG: Rpn family recombination-promoting nuclease/putative transposase [Lachnospiraceae bacterium]